MENCRFRKNVANYDRWPTVVYSFHCNCCKLQFWCMESIIFFFMCYKRNCTTGMATVSTDQTQEDTSNSSATTFPVPKRIIEYSVNARNPKKVEVSLNCIECKQISTVFIMKKQSLLYRKVAVLWEAEPSSVVQTEWRLFHRCLLPPSSEWRVLTNVAGTKLLWNISQCLPNSWVQNLGRQPSSDLLCRNLETYI